MAIAIQVFAGPRLDFVNRSVGAFFGLLGNFIVGLRGIFPGFADAGAEVCP